jgi:hypothetical protein
MEYRLQMHMNARCNHVSEKPEDLLSENTLKGKVLMAMILNGKLIAEEEVVAI